MRSKQLFEEFGAFFVIFRQEILSMACLTFYYNCSLSMTENFSQYICFLSITGGTVYFYLIGHVSTTHPSKNPFLPVPPAISSLTILAPSPTRDIALAYGLSCAA